MKVLGLIPARGNSKRLPGKNLADVGGMSLLARAIICAKESAAFDAILVTTDVAGLDEGIATEAKMLGADYIVRHASIRRDDWTATMSHAIDCLTTSMDAVMVLQPTSPFRQSADIVAAIEMLGPNVDSVVSVTEGADDIAFMLRHARRLEKLPPVVVPNGAIYLIRTNVIGAGGSWYGDYAYGYMMPKERSLDIDYGHDLEVAQYLARKK